MGRMGSRQNSAESPALHHLTFDLLAHAQSWGCSFPVASPRYAANGVMPGRRRHRPTSHYAHAAFRTATRKTASIRSTTVPSSAERWHIRVQIASRSAPLARLTTA